MRSREDARFLQAVGAEFRQLRLERRLSLGAVAERSGMSKSLLSRVERGEPCGYNVVYLWRLARGLGVPPASVVDLAVASLIRREAAARRLRSRRGRVPAQR